MKEEEKMVNEFSVKRHVWQEDVKLSFELCWRFSVLLFFIALIFSPQKMFLRQQSYKTTALPYFSSIESGCGSFPPKHLYHKLTLLLDHRKVVSDLCLRSLLQWNCNKRMCFISQLFKVESWFNQKKQVENTCLSKMYSTFSCRDLVLLFSDFFV